MEKPNPSELFSPEQLAAIQKMVESKVSEPRPRDFSLVSGTSHPELSQKISDLLEKPLCKEKIKVFSSGEKYVNLKESVRNKIAFLIQTCRDQEVDKDLMELFIMSNTAFHADSESRIAVIPYLGYSRQDKIKMREPLTAKLIADLAKTAKIDHAIICHLHAEQEMGFFDMPVDHVYTIDLFASYFREKNLMDPIVVATDAGGAKNVRIFAREHLKTKYAILHKDRPDHNESEVTDMIGDVRGKTCIIFDDIIDTAGSVCNARDELIKQGANPDVYLCATHPIFSGPAIGRLKEAKFKEVVVSDTLPLGPEKQFEGLKQLSVAPLIADWMAKIIGMPLPSGRKADKPK